MGVVVRVLVSVRRCLSTCSNVGLLLTERLIRARTAAGNCMQKVTSACKREAGVRLKRGRTDRRRGASSALVLLLVARVPASRARPIANPSALRARASAELYNLDHERALATFRAGDRRRSPGCRRVSRARERPVAEHHLPPRQHDRRRLPGRRDPAQDGLPAPAARDRRGVQRRDRPGARARARARRGRSARRRRALRSRRGHWPARVLRRDGRRQRPAARSARPARPTTSTKRCSSSTHAARTPGSSSAPTATSSRRWRCRCAGWRTWSGFGGGREQGLQLIEGAAAYVGDNQEEARFALVLLYNRERRYDEALAQLATLRERYPRNRLALARKRVRPSLRGGQDRRRRTVPRRGPAPVRGRRASAHVRRGRALVREARRGPRELWAASRRPGRISKRR